jgi:hypothetical protein
VQWRPGTIRVAPSSLEAVQADAAAFSVSFAELLDRALLPDPRVVGLSERATSGPPALSPPSRVDDGRAVTASGSARPWLALLCALFTAAALATAKKMRVNSAGIVTDVPVRSAAPSGSR